MSIRDKIVKVIQDESPYWVFSPRDFRLPETDVRKILKDLVSDGSIRQISRHFFDRPQDRLNLGVLSPGFEFVLKAAQRYYDITIDPSGAYCANFLGLSTQVPCRHVYLSNGPSRTIHLAWTGRDEDYTMDIELKPCRAKYMQASTWTRFWIHALKFEGPNHVDDYRYPLFRFLNQPMFDTQFFLDEMHLAPKWIRDLVYDVARETL